MQYYSLNNPQHRVSFKEAVVAGLAPDRGLYFPVNIPKLDKDFIERLEEYDPLYIGKKVMEPFIEQEIPTHALAQIISETLSFPFPLREVEEHVFALELYHGPTLAFKDVGARFMAGCLGYFRKGDDRPVTVLAATSGDTGAAVAHGFYNVPGVQVVILYPSGKVSTLQEKQLTTLGGNITALEVQGTFDDCQRLVKTAFNDEDLKEACLLTSANSINVARWLPQMLYYFLAYRKLKQWHKDVVFAVPSGNFGNICAGMMAAQMGLPIHHFIAATNVNDTVPRFMQNGEYAPNPALPTLSNAMDVADPSNFVRILQIFAHNDQALHAQLSAYSFNDEQTVDAIERVCAAHNYLLDPHGAVGYLGLKKYLADHKKPVGVFLETAHPVKFADNMPASVQAKIDTPAKIKQLANLEKQAVLMPNDFNVFKKWLTGQSYAV
ncbi:threonine synthase [Chitinophaga skermanii]|uniref:Threonine synthase n=1 Tax=Chitinophaga skermanii TaxID=331697 RepID=A0A327QT50_9BACT|nr:threonine synthase [Chitinophaga skermanii]RAJ06872.1 threonine synthase [Chitinophaga skermanii]